MNFKSASVRMTLWNVTVLALALLGFAAAVAVTVRSTMSASVDRRLSTGLQHERQQWAGGHGPDHGPPHDHPPGEDHGPPGFDNRMPGPNGQMHGPDGPMPGLNGQMHGPNDQIHGPGPRHGGDPFHAPDNPTASADGLMPPRPRLFTLQGKSVGPPEAHESLWDNDAFHQAAAGATVYSTVVVDDQPLRVLSAPLKRHGQIASVVQVVYPLGEMQLLLDQLVHVLLALIPFSLAAAGLGGLFLTDRVLQPIRRLRQMAREITAHDLSRRMELKGDDEFTELSRTFNEMIGRLEESFEQQRRFVGDASHELRTPLATIMGSTSLALSNQRSPEEYRQALDVAGTAARRMNRIVDDLLLLARSDSGQVDLEKQPFPAADLLTYARDAVSGSPGPPIHVELPDPSVQVECDAEYLVRVFVNLLNNALRHTPDTGQVCLSARSEGDTVTVVVSDTGEGIAPEHLARLGERFYRADQSRTRHQGGTGLGLAICQSILQAHGGSLQIRSVLGEGTRVTVLLPVYRCPS